MTFIPKKTKFRKQQKGSYSGCSYTGTEVSFGDFGIQALERGWITNRQMEACRVVINRHFKRKGKVWSRVFPDKPVSKKPAETRMGKGKGATDHWVAVVRPGNLVFEVGNVTKKEAQDALRRAAAKLGIKTRFVERLETV